MSINGASATIGGKTGGISSWSYESTVLCPAGANGISTGATATPSPLNTVGDGFSVTWAANSNC